MEPMVSSCQWGVWRWCCVSGRMWVIWSGGSKVCCLAVNEALSLWHAEKREKKEGVPQGPSKVLVWSRRPLLHMHSPYRAAVDSLTHTHTHISVCSQRLQISLLFSHLTERECKATTLSNSFFHLNTHTRVQTLPLLFSISHTHWFSLNMSVTLIHHMDVLWHTPLLSQTVNWNLTAPSRAKGCGAFLSSAIYNIKCYVKVLIYIRVNLWNKSLMNKIKWCKLVRQWFCYRMLIGHLHKK